MIRIGLIVIVTVVVGVVSGVGLTWWNLGGVENNFGLARPNMGLSEAEVEAAPRAILAGENTFDFGSLEHNQKGKHVFAIRNEGEGSLVLETGSISCGMCLQTSFKEATVEPGQTIEIEIQYTTKKNAPQFRERLEVITNDPIQPVLDLNITGYVTHAVRASVDELAVGAVSVNEDNTARFRLYGYQSDTLEVLKYEFVRPGTADLFEVDIQPLEKGEYDDEPKARVALEVTLTIKPGLPIGPISQTIQLRAKAKNESDIEVAIAGKVVSDITIVGRGFDADRNVINFGNVSVDEGRRHNLRILVKGPYRDDVDFSVKKIDPAANLQAKIGDVIKVGDGSILMYPLDIEILKDAPIVNRLGTEQGAAGKIVLGTTHPTAKEVLVYVRFALIE